MSSLLPFSPKFFFPHIEFLIDLVLDIRKWRDRCVRVAFVKGDLWEDRFNIDVIVRSVTFVGLWHSSSIFDVDTSSFLALILNSMDFQ